MSTPVPPIPPPPARDRLERPRDGRLLSGVCAGFARHLGVDVTLVRIAVVVLSVIGGAGVVAYLVALVIVPEEGAAEPLASSGRLDEDGRMPFVIAGLLIACVLGGVGFGGDWGWWDDGGWVLVLLAGGALVWHILRGRRADADTAPATPSAAMASPVAPSAPTPPATDAPAGEATTAIHPATPPADPEPRRRAPGIAIGATLLALGGVGLLASAIDDMSWQTAVAIGVLACGVIAVAAAPLGGVRTVVGLGFALAAIGGVAAAADLELRGGFGDRLEEPATVRAIPDEYRLAAGTLEIDLRATSFPRGTTTVRARSGMGEILVRAPADVTVIARGRAGLGEVDVLGREEDGGGPDVRARSPETGPVRVLVDARVGLGKVEIEQAGVREGIG